jgi:hypothetical protein
VCAHASSKVGIQRSSKVVGIARQRGAEGFRKYTHGMPVLLLVYLVHQQLPFRLLMVKIAPTLIQRNVLLGDGCAANIFLP